MTPAFEPSSIVVVFHPADRKLAANACPSAESVFDGKSLSLFSLSLSTVERVRYDLERSGCAVLVLLDRFVFLLPKQDRTRQALFMEFFEYIATVYEELIDVSRNRQNVQNLLFHLRSIIGDLKGKHLLDFGCGTGLAIQSLAESGASYVGLDQSVHMREVARGRGMAVISLRDLPGFQSTFDGAIASYVFHLTVDDDALRGLWRSLKQPGVLIANFHKGFGVERINQFFEKLHCQIVNLGGQPTSIHGPYYAYAKLE